MPHSYIIIYLAILCTTRHTCICMDSYFSFVSNILLATAIYILAFMYVRIFNHGDVFELE